MGHEVRSQQDQKNALKSEKHQEDPLQDTLMDPLKEDPLQDKSSGALASSETQVGLGGDGPSTPPDSPDGPPINLPPPVLTALGGMAVQMQRKKPRWGSNKPSKQSQQVAWARKKYANRGGPKANKKQMKPLHMGPPPKDEKGPPKNPVTEDPNKVSEDQNQNEENENPKQGGENPNQQEEREQGQNGPSEDHNQQEEREQGQNGPDEDPNQQEEREQGQNGPDEDPNQQEEREQGQNPQEQDQDENQDQEQQNRGQQQVAPPQPTPINVPPELTFEPFRKATYRRFSSRDKNLKIIDRWLKVLEEGGTRAEKAYALEQVYDACEYWLSVNGGEKKKKEDSSVSHRRSPVKDVHAAAGTLLGQAGVKGYGTEQGGDGETMGDETDGSGGDLAVEDLSEDMQEGLGGAFDSIGGGSGITGDYGDINLLAVDAFKKKHGDNATSDDAMSKAGGGTINDPKADMFEGANVFGGMLAMQGAKKKFKDKDASGVDKAEAVAEGAAGAGQTAHGALKFGKGAAILGGADSTKMTKMGDFGASFADGTAAVSGLVSFAGGIYRNAKKSKEEGGLTSKEKVDAVAEGASTLVGTGQASVNFAKDIIKIGTEVGGKDAMGYTAEGAKATISGMTTAAGILGIISGSIDMLHGGFQLFKGYASKKAVDQAIKVYDDTDARLKTDADAVKKKLAEEKDQLPEEELAKVHAEAQKLEVKAQQLAKLRQQYQPVFDSMKMIQGRKQEAGAIKMAKGAAGVVSGALLVSGVGAPVAIAFAAIGGIIALGHAVVKGLRNRAANKLTLLAQRLSPDGKPKAMPDESMPYREMEKRVGKCYYANLPKVLEKKAPTGMEKGEFSNIKNFVWQKKVDEAKSFKDIDDPSQAANQENQEKTWFAVPDKKKKNKKLYNEKPTGISRVSLAFTASAHKSKQAQGAAAEDVANALYDLGSSGYDPALKKFVPAPVVIEGDAPKGDEEMTSQIKSATFEGLLKAADISESRWTAWYQTAGGKTGEGRDPEKDVPDPKKMKDLIKKQVGG
ncbi:MAG: hypothetical protein HN348_07935 [Proteobacteria bacterium]|jgi:hypothetical protein|nr:hypothetical protein [Pseudomonadota bacterium]